VIGRDHPLLLDFNVIYVVFTDFNDRGKALKGETGHLKAVLGGDDAGLVGTRAAGDD
jgi:hypothetical protein